MVKVRDKVKIARKKRVNMTHQSEEKGYSKTTDYSINRQQRCDPDGVQVVINIEDMIRTAHYLPPNRDYCCIHKVPVNLRNVNEAAYTPQILSIGPLHRDDKKLKPMQAYKISFLNTLLQRNPSIKLEDFVKTLKGLEEQVRKSYFDQEFVCNMSSNDFVEMMLLDGCFIVEFLSSSGGEMLWDPYSSIVHFDLTLFENQLPYFLLEHLFNFIKCNNPSCRPVSFFDLSARNFSYFLNKKDADRLKNSDYQVKHFLDLILNSQGSSGLTDAVKDTHRLKNLGHQVKHILDFIRNCCMPTGLKPSANDNMDMKHIYLPSATELHESGVEFKKGESDCFLDIKFNKNGVLEMSALNVEDNKEHMFRNMIAMEQCQVRTTDVGNTAYITHYIILLDFLISTPKDVALLRRKKIINNYLGSDEEVAELINKLGTGVIANTTDSPYYEHLKNMDAFYNRRWNKWKANLKRKYFQNPWTILSLIAAIVLLICTIAQTVYSLISHFQ